MRSRSLREARWILAILGMVWLAALKFVPWASPLVSLLVLFTFYFFRDPRRDPPLDPALAVSAADGVVTTVDEVEEGIFLKRKMKRIGIFLSVFDVHVNRSPIEGVVGGCEYKPGAFLDARDPESSTKNESCTWLFEGPQGRVVVKQITGAIARRICMWSPVGASLRRGERFGMIRFGSRTEIFVDPAWEVLVKVGDRVRGGETAVVRIPS